MTNVFYVATFLCVFLYLHAEHLVGTMRQEVKTRCTVTKDLQCLLEKKSQNPITKVVKLIHNLQFITANLNYNENIMHHAGFFVTQPATISTDFAFL